MPDVTAEQIAASEAPAAQPSEPAQQQAPVETAAPDTAETVAETDEQKNARELAEQRDRSEKRARGVQRRFDELTAEKYAERQRADGLQRLVEQLVTAKQQPNPQGNEEAEPRRENYPDYEDFVAAKAEFKAARRAEAILAKRFDGAAQASREMQVQQEASQLRQRFVAKQQEFAKATPDYFDVVNTEDVRVPEATAALLHTMDDAPQVIYHMAKNPEVAAKFWNEPPVRQAILLGQLSATLKGAPQLSKAPEPGKPTGARSGESGTPPQDMEGYMKWRAKQRSGNHA